MQLFDGHVATIKAVLIQIKLNRFLVKKNSEKLISSHLKHFADSGTIICKRTQ